MVWTYLISALLVKSDKMSKDSSRHWSLVPDNTIEKCACFEVERGKGFVDKWLVAGAFQENIWMLLKVLIFLTDLLVTLIKV